MSPELIGIITVGTGLAVLMVGLLAWLRQDMNDLGNRLDKAIKEQGIRLDEQGDRLDTAIKEQGIRFDKEMKEQGDRLDKAIKEQGIRLDKEIKEQGEKHSNDLTEVKVEVAALRATVETYFRVRVDPPRQAAVAEDPEDYGTD